jgi:proline racemase
LGANISGNWYSRVAILLAERRIAVGRLRLIHRSIIGTELEADVVSEEKSPVDGFPACIPRVRGHANLVGRMHFFIDPNAAVFPGFLL